MTHEEYVEFLRIHRPELIVNENYINNTTKISYTSLRCGHTWMAKPEKIKIGRGCPKCARNQKLTHDEYVEHLSLNNPDFIVNEEYNGTHSKISHTHLTCGYTWSVVPNRIKRKSPCPNCNGQGFNPTKPSTGYVLLFDTFIKFGVTTNLKRRLASHRTKNGAYTVHYIKDFDTGEKGLEWESKIKSHFGYVNGAVTKNECSDGYTETLPINLLNDLENLINQMD